MATMIAMFTIDLPPFPHRSFAREIVCCLSTTVWMKGSLVRRRSSPVQGTSSQNLSEYQPLLSLEIHAYQPTQPQVSCSCLST